VLGTSALRVLGAGAGTGKLTAEIVRHGHEAIAVDPGPAMLDALHNTLSVVETHVGAAEATACRRRASAPMTADGLVAMARPRSYYIAGTQDRKERLENGLALLFSGPSELVETGRIDLPYVTRAHRVRRP